MNLRKKCIAWILIFIMSFSCINVPWNMKNVSAEEGDLYTITYTIEEGGYFYYENGPASYTKTSLTVSSSNCTFNNNMLLMEGCTYRDENGYKLLGWRRVDNGVETDEIYSESDVYIPTADTEFRAVTEYVGYKTVSFHTNREAVEDFSLVSDYSGMVIPNSCWLDNEYVEFWETADGEKIENKIAYYPENDVDLYAVWKNCFYVSYNLNGGYWPGPSGDSIEVAPVGEKYNIRYRSDFIKQGFIFVGYYIDGDDSNKIYNPGDEISVNDNIELVAKWVEDTGNYNTVTYELDGGYYYNGPEGKKYGDITRTYSDVINTINVGDFDGPYKDGCKFIGWKVKGGDDTIYESSYYDWDNGGYRGGVYNISGDVTFVAVWNSEGNNILIDENSFPDSVFRQYVLDNADTDNDGFLSKEEITALTKIDIGGYNYYKRQVVSSLKGIEYFEELNELRLAYSNLTTLDFSPNSKLKKISLIHNYNLENVDISDNILLENFSCSNDSPTICDVGLRSINLENNTNLKVLGLNNNRITELDVSKNINLTNLSLVSIAIEDLDLSNNRELTSIRCNNTNISSLNTDNNNLLEILECQANQNLTEVNVYNNSLLKDLFISAPLTNVDLSNNDLLERLSVCGLNGTDGGLSELDVSNCLNLYALFCENNNLTTLDLSHNTKLINVECNNNKINNLILGNNTNLNSLRCYENELYSIDLSGCVNLTTISASDNYLNGLDLSNNEMVTFLNCSNNYITDLDLLNLSNLSRLACSNNQIKTLDFSHNDNLSELLCQNNSIDNLDLRNTKIKNVYTDIKNKPIDVFCYALCDENTKVLHACDKGNHSWNLGEIIKESTCSNNGTKKYTCNVCGDIYYEDMPVKGHTVVIDKAVPATLATTGLTEGKHCSVCGAVITKQQVVPILNDSKNEEKNQKESERKKYSNEWINGKWYNADGTCTYFGTLSWKCNSTGWWIEDTAGWYPHDSWQKIDGAWYYFKSDGYMAENEYYNGYWFNSNGTMDDTYYLKWLSNSTGWWVEDKSGWWPSSKWLKIDGSWYYFDSSGYMVTNQYVDGYWIGSDGVCS